MRAAVVARVSSIEQDREGKTSLDEQVDRCRVEIERRGWTLDEEHVFVDRVSGDKLSRFDRPLQAAYEGRFDVLVFTAFNRLARNLSDLLAIHDELVDHNIDLVCLETNLDTTTPAGRAQFQMAGVFAEWQKADLLAQMARGVHALARRDPGRYIGGEVPFGLSVTGDKGEPNRRLVPNPAEVETVKVAYDLLVNQGHTTHTAAAELNARSLLPRKAARWDNVLLRAALTKETLRGVQVWAKLPRESWSKPARGERGHVTTTKYGPPVEMAIPAVLSEDEWTRLQAVLGASSTPTPIRSPEAFLLSGRGHQRLWAPCGSVMTGLHQDGRTRRYRCMARFKGGGCGCQRIDADELEELVRMELVGLSLDPDRLTQAVRDWTEPEPGNTRVTPEDLDARIARAEAKRTNIILAAADLGPDAIKDAVTQVEQEIETLRRRRELRTSALDSQAQAEALVPEFLRMVTKADRLGTQGWRALLALADVQVVITGWLPRGLHTMIGDPIPPYRWVIEGNLWVGDAPASGICARTCRQGARR